MLGYRKEGQGFVNEYILVNHKKENEERVTYQGSSREVSGRGEIFRRPMTLPTNERTDEDSADKLMPC